MKKILLFNLLLVILSICCACDNLNTYKTGEELQATVENTKSNNKLSKVGEMVVPRIAPGVIELNDNQLLIVGGYKKSEIKQRDPKMDGGPQYRTENIDELSAEIYNLKINKSQLLSSKPFFNPIIINAIKISNGNILFSGGKKPQIFDVKSNKFKELDNIFNDSYTGLNAQFIELNNDKGMFCSTYTHQPNNVKCFLVNTNDFNLINVFQIPPFDNYMFKYSKMLKLGTDKLLVFTTLKTFNSPNREVYISEYSISKEKFVKHTILEDVGNVVSVNAINDDFVLLSGVRSWGYGSKENPTLSIYSVSKEKKIKTFDVDNFLGFYEKDVKLVSSEYILNPKTFELEPNNEHIDLEKYNLPKKSTKISLKDRKYLIFGGRSSKGKPLKDVYIIDNPKL